MTETFNLTAQDIKMIYEAGTVNKPLVEVFYEFYVRDAHPDDEIISRDLVYLAIEFMLKETV